MKQPTRRTIPSKPLTDAGFEYRSSAATDVQSTWKRFGWTPPSEMRAIPDQKQRALQTSQL